MPLTIDELERKLLELADDSQAQGSDKEVIHGAADKLLIEYIEAGRTTRISDAFNAHALRP